jgi:hypothetical protein
MWDVASRDATQKPAACVAGFLLPFVVSVIVKKNNSKWVMRLLTGSWRE